MGLGRAEHDADLFADLVGEDAKRLRAIQVAGELAHRLRHHARLRADGLVAHLPLELHARGERGDRVDRDHVDRTGAHKHVGDLQRLLAIVGLRYEQLVDVDADPLRVERIHRVLCIDERAHAAELLRLGEYVIDHRRLARVLLRQVRKVRPALQLLQHVLGLRLRRRVALRVRTRLRRDQDVPRLHLLFRLVLVRVRRVVALDLRVRHRLLAARQLRRVERRILDLPRLRNRRRILRSILLEVRL